MLKIRNLFLRPWNNFFFFKLCNIHLFLNLFLHFQIIIRSKNLILIIQKFILINIIINNLNINQIILFIYLFFITFWSFILIYSTNCIYFIFYLFFTQIKLVFCFHYFCQCKISYFLLSLLIWHLFKFILLFLNAFETCNIKITGRLDFFKF